MPAAENATILQVQELCFGFAPQHLLFDRLSLALPPGLALIVGDDGSGKTSLLRLLAGELQPQAGRAVLSGCDVVHDAPGYRRQVFWRSPHDAWPERLTPQDWALEQAVRASWQASAWLAHVQGLGLQTHLHKPMYQLSTGSKRKVLLAAALASGATLTLIDEPEAALDRASIGYLHQALAHHGQDTGRVLLLAHYERLGQLPWQQVLELAN